MSKLRTALVGLTAIGLLGLPGAALAGSASSGAHQAVVRHDSTIRWMGFDHIRAAGTPMTIVGQVVSSAHGQRGALADVGVRLYRRLTGNPNWVLMGTGSTSDSAQPEFRFVTSSRQNADYKVAFAGNGSFAPTSGITWLTVYRHFNGHVIDGAGAATYRGNVTPYYTHKPITLQKRACASCPYVTYRSRTTGANGAYSFALPAPPSGRWWWRLTVPGTTSFIRSYGATITTELR